MHYWLLNTFILQVCNWSETKSSSSWPTWKWMRQWLPEIHFARLLEKLLKFHSVPQSDYMLQKKMGCIYHNTCIVMLFCPSQPLVTIQFDCIQHSTQQRMWSNYFKHSMGDIFHSCSVRLALAMFLCLRLGLFWLLYVCKGEEGYDFTLTARGQERCVFVLLCMWSLGMLLITAVLL